MTLTPYLGFNGNCAEAFKFYEKALGGTLNLIPFGSIPAAGPTPPELSDKIMHARLLTPEFTLMGSDNPPGRESPAKGFCVAIGLSDPAEAERVHAALSEGGSIDMPLQQTFWAKRFSMFRDRFGIPWMVNCE